MSGFVSGREDSGGARDDHHRDTEGTARRSHNKTTKATPHHRDTEDTEKDRFSPCSQCLCGNRLSRLSATKIFAPGRRIHWLAVQRDLSVISVSLWSWFDFGCGEPRCATTDPSPGKRSTPAGSMEDTPAAQCYSSSQFREIST